MTQDFENERDELQRVLEIYGADRARWPAASRARLERTLQVDAASRRLYAEARALDRVIDYATSPAPAQIASLADRIMAAAAAAPGEPVLARPAFPAAPTSATSADGRVIALRRAPRAAQQAPANDVLTRRTAWQSAALVAASLLVGLYIGAGSLVLPIMQDVAESVGIVAELDPRGLSGLDELGDEDTL